VGAQAGCLVEDNLEMRFGILIVVKMEREGCAFQAGLLKLQVVRGRCASRDEEGERSRNGFFAITFARSTKYPLFTLLALPRAESRVGF